MSNVITYQRFWQRRDTAANWVAVNPVLAAGEIGVELDATPVRFKIGDGTKAWNALRYQADGPEPSVTVPIVGGVATLDGSLGHFFSLSLSANATLAVINPPTGADCLILRVTQAGSFTLTLPASMTTISGTPYVASTGAGKTDVLGLMTLDGGASFLVAVQQPA